MDSQPDLIEGDIRALADTLAARLIGHEVLTERLLIALLTGGHLLVEGAPGLAKTRAVTVLSEAVSGTTARIQCTPDLLPSDLTGTPVWRPETGEFEFAKGPVFHNLVLVDEINRAPPKVQSALLEAMAERQVSTGGETHRLPDPFLVIATQNPIEHDGTFPLPEAQLDRFLMHVLLDLPDLETERRILDLVESETQNGVRPPRPVAMASLLQAREEVRRIHLAPELRDYIVRLVVATREGEGAADIEHAASPRGSIALAAAARARAWLGRRDYVAPEDVAALAADTLAHRLSLTWRAVAEGKTARGVVAKIFAGIEPL